MSIINIDLNQEKLQIEKFNNTTEQLKKTFADTMENCISDINTLNITYFEDLEKYVEKIVEENEKFYNGTNYYVKSLNELKDSIDFKIKQEPLFKAPGKVISNETVDDAVTTGEYDSSLEEMTTVPETIPIAVGAGAYGSEINTLPENNDDITVAAGALGAGISGLQELQQYPDESPIQKVQEQVDFAVPKYAENDYTSPVIAAASGITLPKFGELGLGDIDSSDASSFIPFGTSFGQLNSASLKSDVKEGSNLTSGLGETSDTQRPIAESQLGNLAITGPDNMQKEDINIEKADDGALTDQVLDNLKKSGLSGGSLAGTILSVVLTGALGFGSLAFDKFGKGDLEDSLLGTLNQDPTIVKDTLENGEMLVGQQITTTYKDPQFQLAEYSSNFISDLANNPTTTEIDYDTRVMNYANEFGRLSPEEIEFGMSGLPYVFENLSKYERGLAFQELASLIDHYGGIEGLLEHYDEVHDYLQKVGSSYDVLEAIMNLSIEEQRNALRGLLDEENPNINGLPITKEARDFIIEYLERITGLSIDELLSGEHDEVLKKALSSLLSILKVLKVLGSLTYEELEMFLYDLINGRFTELCGITSQNVALFKHFLDEESEKLNVSNDEIVSNFEYKDELKDIISKFADSKYEIGKMLERKDLYDIILKIFNDEELPDDLEISLFTKQFLINIIRIYAKYFNKDIKLFINSQGFREILHDILEKLNKYMMFIGILVTLKDDSLQLRIYETFIGLWIGLLGFSVVEIGNLKKKLEKEKEKYNIDLALIINDLENASALKSMLENDDIYNRLLLIFNNIEDEELQKLISNLLKSWENEHIYDLKNLIVYVNRKKLNSIIKYCQSKTKFNVASIKVDQLKVMIDKLYSLSEEDLYKEFSNIYYRTSNMLEKEQNSMLLIYLIMIVLLALSIRYTMTVKDMLKDEKIKKNCYEMIKNTPYYMNYINPKNKLYDENKISELMVNLLSGKYKNLIGEANLE